MTAQRTPRPTKADVGRSITFHGFDGRQYPGRIDALARRRWLVITYRVPSVGEVTAYLDLRVQSSRVVLA